MNRAIEEAYQKFASFRDKFGDPELDDFLLGLVRKLEDADMLYHQLGYLVMHVRATVVYQARPKHLNEAIERAERLLGRYAQEMASSESRAKN